MDMPEALDFNPHFRKGSDKKNEQRDVKQGNFNPHFRKGSDSSTSGITPIRQISIHTSAREVTPGLCRRAGELIISIHTSAREVTGYK